MGYRPTKGDTDDLKKLHCCIKPYNELDETTKHYDWSVVKNSLSTTEVKSNESEQATQLPYTPNPISTEEVTLSPEILELSEKIAENVHEVWAQSRISEGWIYGLVRDDVKKQHPCLIPYDELPEIEKEYDRNTSQETLKVIMKLGFKIEK
jgi:ryanodine receptor 2